MNLQELATQLKETKENIVLIYAFNATGKTRLSVVYTDLTTDEKGERAGVYYNAFSEDLFVWDNDIKGNGEHIRLTVLASNLNRFHASLNEIAIRQKLTPYKPKYDFEFSIIDPGEGIDSIKFYLEGDDEKKPIKISRGEERIFVWCFFLALFEVEGWADELDAHFFIDDPVSSLDDNNIFVTASTIYDLIENYFEKRKIIIATHHIGLYSILYDWLLKGEKSRRYERIVKALILSREGDELSLGSPRNTVFLYHLHLLQTLDKANREQLYNFHFALLRQLLENVGSFLGSGQIGYVLQQIDIQNPNEVAAIVNSLSHKKVYYFEDGVMNEDNQATFKKVFERLLNKYQFRL